MVRRHRIEVARRFVGDNNLRMRDDGTSDPDPLFLATGHLTRIMVGSVQQIHSAQGNLNSSASFAAGHGQKQQRQLDVFVRRQYRDKIVCLEDVSQIGRSPVGQFCAGQASDFGAVDHDSSTVWLVDTGDETQTGGRLRRVVDYIKDEDAICFTYGDGVSDVDIGALIAFHKKHGKLATVTAVQPPGRYGALKLDASNAVSGFTEKPRGDGGMINGGFFVLSPKCVSLIDGDNVSWEAGPLAKLAELGELVAFRHDGFWQPMDTLREKNLLEDLWDSGKAPWKIWS